MLRTARSLPGTAYVQRQLEYMKALSDKCWQLSVFKYFRKIVDIRNDAGFIQPILLAVRILVASILRVISEGTVLIGRLLVPMATVNVFNITQASSAARTFQYQRCHK